MKTPLVLKSNSALKEVNPKDGQVIFVPNYRIDVKLSSDGSFSKTIVTDRTKYNELSYYFGQLPKFIFDFLNKTTI